MRLRYDNRRAVLTLSGLVRLRLKIQWCENRHCSRRHCPVRPEAEGAIVLPILAATATRSAVFSDHDLAVADRARWQKLRKALETRRQARACRTRFCRDQGACLTNLERLAGQQRLPT